MALSLRLYSLEIRLKACVCRILKLSHLPKVCKTHDLSELIIFTGLWEELENPASAILRRNWDLYQVRKIRALLFHGLCRLGKIDWASESHQELDRCLSRAITASKNFND